MLRRVGRAGAGVVVLLLQTLALANPAEPQWLKDVNVSRTIRASLVVPQNATEPDRDRMTEARDWIARSNLVMMNMIISVDRLRQLFHWERPEPPLFAPGVIPLSGYKDPPESYVINRAENWRVWPDHTISLDVIWVPVADPDKPFFKESQRYRQVNQEWLLFQQDRTRVATCRGDPRCVSWPR